MRSVPSIGEQASGESAALWIRAGLLVAVGALVYWNGLSGPFTFDDGPAVVFNDQIRRLWPLSDVLSPMRPDQPIAGRPIVSLSFAINYALGGLSPRGYHLGNIAVHVLCGVLLFASVRRTLVAPRLAPRFAEGTATNVAFVGALIWMVHPLQTETVDYVSARTESMMSLFYLLTMYASIRAHGSRRSAIWLVLSVLCCAMGMGCKEAMATAPLMVLLYDRTFVFASLKEALRDRGLFYLGLAATWLGLAALLWFGPRAATIGFSTTVTPWTYLLNQSVLIARYLRLAFWPRLLVFDYGTPQPLTLVQAAPSGAVIVGLLLMTAAALVWRPAIGFLGAWFFVILAPSSSFIPIATEAGAERRMYLPLAAVVFAAVIAGYLCWQRVFGGDQSSTPELARASGVGGQDRGGRARVRGAGGRIGPAERGVSIGADALARSAGPVAGAAGSPQRGGRAENNQREPRGNPVSHARGCPRRSASPIRARPRVVRRGEAR